MCTVVIRMPETAGDPIRLLALRDEDPARPWDPLGPWWPEQPGVIGVRDRRAGGAWLAADPARGRVAVLLNRAGPAGVDEPESPESRGTIALAALAERELPARPRTRRFNLVDVDPAGARLLAWDGRRVARTELGPGVHMVAHDDVDDPRTARIEHWLPAFRDADLAGDDWWESWVSVLADSAALAGDDPRAIIRDQTFEGVASATLLVCVATVTADGADVRYAALPRPGAWQHPDFG